MRLGAPGRVFERLLMGVTPAVVASRRAIALRRAFSGPQTRQNAPSRQLPPSAATPSRLCVPPPHPHAPSACTGTNFCLRCAPLADCGFFPSWTITEDYALGMILKAKVRGAPWA